MTAPSSAESRANLSLCGSNPLVVRGDRPGLVHIISAMEACDTYKPWHDKHTHRTFLRPDTGKCLHYYFYFG